MRPVDHSGPVTGPVSPWVLKRKFQPGFRDEKRGRVLARNRPFALGGHVTFFS